MKIKGRSILFAFGTASLLPILFIGIFLTVRMRTMAYDQSLKEANAEIARVKSRTEEMLGFIYNIQNTIISDTQITNIAQKKYTSAYEIFSSYYENNLMDKYELIVVNFANQDMVGHTAVIPAVIKAVETADSCLGEIIELLKEKDGKALITADHGNAEKLIDEVTGGPFTAHTTNKVPLILFGEGDAALREGKLADIAPTLLDMMGLEAPEEMTGESLIIQGGM